MFRRIIQHPAYLTKASQEIYSKFFTIKYTENDILFLMNPVEAPGEIIKFEGDSRESFDTKYIDNGNGIYVYHNNTTQRLGSSEFYYMSTQGTRRFEDKLYGNNPRKKLELTRR